MDLTWSNVSPPSIIRHERARAGLFRLPVISPYPPGYLSIPCVKLRTPQSTSRSRLNVTMIQDLATTIADNGSLAEFAHGVNPKAPTNL